MGALAFLAACDASPPRTAGVRLDVGPDGVEFGTAFPVAVTRVSRAGAEMPPWDDGVLAPLDVRAKATSRATDAGRALETRTFDAYAFRAGDVEVPAARTAIRVRHAVDPARPGDPELPGEPLRPPLPAWVTVLSSAASLALVVLLVRRIRTGRMERIAPAPPAPPPPRPDEVALAALAEIRPDGDVHRETAAILRVYVHRRFGVPALERTTEELAADPAVPAEHLSALASLLGAADLVKFACAEPTPGGPARLVADAQAFVRATGAPPA